MQTLNGRVQFYMSSSTLSGKPRGLQHFHLQKKTSSTNWADVFFGSFYYNGEYTYYIDVTDIVKSTMFVPQTNYFEGTYETVTSLIDCYRVVVQWTNGVTTTLSSQWIVKCYNYINQELNPWYWITMGVSPDSWSAQHDCVPMIQGYIDDDRENLGLDRGSILVPHYPMFQYPPSEDDEDTVWDPTENNCPYGIVVKRGRSCERAQIHFEVGPKRFDDLCENMMISVFDPTLSYATLYISNVGNLAWWTDPEYVPTSDGVAYLTDRQWVIDCNDMGMTEGLKCYVRYEDGDRSGNEYRYAYAYLPDCDDMWAGDVTAAQLENVDEETLLWGRVEYPTTGAITGDMEDANGNKYVVGDDGAWIGYYKHKVAIFDLCYKRYYLFWQDRWGSFQCQGFNDRAKYTESFNKSEVVKYTDQRKLSNVKVQPKWKISSGWIEEALYPYYESIFVSPMLILFDTKLNERFSVIVKGDYEEKTFKDTKKLINMTLDLELDEKQEMIY